MWPFSSRKDAGLIDRTWISKNNLPIEIREAFQWSNKELKKEIKNYDKSKKTYQERLAEKRSTFEKNELKRSDKETQKKVLESTHTEEQLETNAELSLLKKEIVRIALENDNITVEILDLETLITQCQEVNYVLNRILKGQVKTPGELTAEVENYKGTFGKEWSDKNPSLKEIINNSDD